MCSDVSSRPVEDCGHRLSSTLIKQIKICNSAAIFCLVRLAKVNAHKTLNSEILIQS